MKTDKEAAIIKKIFKINKTLCKKLAGYLPQARKDIFKLYIEIVKKHMNSKPNLVIADIGGGSQCLFARYKKPGLRTKIIAVDVSGEELKKNLDVDEKRVADIMQSLPFEREEVDIITSRAVLEHLERLDHFINNSTAILKENGYFIHLFPSKFSPFAIINQLLPKWISRKLLYYIRPEHRETCGFDAFYNKCYYSGIKTLLEQHDFEIIEIYFSYYQSPYFNFLVPLFLISAIYEIILNLINAKNLCAYLLVVARKKPALEKT